MLNERENREERSWMQQKRAVPNQNINAVVQKENRMEKGEREKDICQEETAATSTADDAQWLSSKAAEDAVVVVKKEKEKEKRPANRNGQSIRLLTNCILFFTPHITIHSCLPFYCLSHSFIFIASRAFLLPSFLADVSIFAWPHIDCLQCTLPGTHFAVPIKWPFLFSLHFSSSISAKRVKEYEDDVLKLTAAAVAEF